MAVRLQDVAAYAGVSMKTVSNVVHDYPHVSPAMRERVQRAIDDLGYRPNALGRRLATGRSGLLALAFSDIRLPYFAQLASAVAVAAANSGSGYRVLLEETAGTLDGERSVLSAEEAGLVDGLLFQPSVMSTTEIAQRHGDIPLVLLGEGAAPLSVDRVMIDNVAAAKTAVAHLVALGRRRIAFVGHERSSPSTTSRLRLQGYQEGLDEFGIPLDMDLLVAVDPLSAPAAAESLGTALDAGLRMDGIVCRDDLAAFGALRALGERGIAVPEEVAVVGWDDIDLAAVTRPSITTIAPDLSELARVALDLLLERIDGFDGLGRHRIVPFQLVLRESAPAA